jgi:hypothetical protein
MEMTFNRETSRMRDNDWQFAAVELVLLVAAGLVRWLFFPQAPDYVIYGLVLLALLAFGVYRIINWQ